MAHRGELLSQANRYGHTSAKLVRQAADTPAWKGRRRERKMRAAYESAARGCFLSLLAQELPDEDTPLEAALTQRETERIWRRAVAETERVFRESFGVRFNDPLRSNLVVIPQSLN